MKIHIGLKEKDREGVSEILNTLLADEHVLYVKLRNFHWNVVGLDFADFHEVFGKQYDETAEAIDEIAERIRALGLRPAGTMKEFLAQARIQESKTTDFRGKTLVGELLGDNEAIIRSLREDLQSVAEKFGDMGTSDFLTGLMEKHEKTAWMLRAYLE